MPERVIEELDVGECLRLISPGGVGRIAYTGRTGPTVLPVNYRLVDEAIMFRTAEHGEIDEDLRTGIANAEYKVAFEIDHIDTERQQGWSVLIQGPLHYLTDAERDEFNLGTVVTWALGPRELFLRITPSRITGRRVRPA
jgi:nitroimidazol reductase NimA-like FMN-containing flavoprotein (pyridoxamine 5'-phosphate oxidase superfamily)